MRKAVAMYVRRTGGKVCKCKSEGEKEVDTR